MVIYLELKNGRNFYLLIKFILIIFFCIIFLMFCIVIIKLFLKILFRKLDYIIF